MITFFACITILILGYFFMGRVMHKLMHPNDINTTPAFTLQDHIDYVPLSRNKNLIIELLNIAGTGPIFGPIMGILYGPVALLWITFGTIFFGAIHDYFFGMISLRNKGTNLPLLAGKIIAKPFKHIVNFFSLLLLLLVATVFVKTPSAMLFDMFHNSIPLWVFIVLCFFYYFLNTMLPIDKIIGKIYPFFGAILIFSSLALIISLFVHHYHIPELTFKNLHPKGLPIYPLLFLTISCGAISGFHATQSPIVARTLSKESHGLSVFAGAMYLEAIIALIWATIAMSIFPGGLAQLSSLIAQGTPSLVVNKASLMLLGGFIGHITIIGMIVLPITSGGSAFRAFRLILAEYINLPQNKQWNRLIIAVPVFAISIILLQVNFDILWKFFTWSNQCLAAITFWVITIYLSKKHKPYFIPLLSAMVLTHVVLTYIFYDKNFALQWSLQLSVLVSLAILAVILIVFFKAMSHKSNKTLSDVV